MAFLCHCVNAADLTEAALTVAAAQLKEEAKPDEFTATSRHAALRTVEAARAALKWGGGEEGES